MQITEQQFDPSLTDLALTFSNLGGLYTEMRRYREAEDNYRRSLTIWEQISPVPLGKIQRTLHDLSKAYRKEGDNISAEDVLAHAVDVARRNPVVDSETPKILDAYADIMKSLGKSQEAQRFHDEARRIRATMALTVRVSK